MLRNSLRGTYDRKERVSAARKKAPRLTETSSDQNSTAASASPASGERALLETRGGEDIAQYLADWAADSSRLLANPQAPESFADRPTRSFIPPSSGREPCGSFGEQAVTDMPAVTTVSSIGSATEPALQSLPAMFEEFLCRQGVSSEGRRGRCGFVLLSETSPLTFALEGVQVARPQAALGSETQQSNEETSQQTVKYSGKAPLPGHHPNHMTPEDISSLKAKGAFDFPEPKVGDALVRAFVTRFYPLYSLVDVDEFESLYKEEKVPWILLNAVYLIGATFCDATVIHQSSFERRSRARRAFYDRTKALFDLGYEKNQLVLIQTAVMMTFSGPHLKSYWNPSSWVDFATTIAASLGIHRTSGLMRFPERDRGLLRRVWSIILARDASCATLLGRPFRIRTSQCDNTVSCEDFPQSASVPPISALYQIYSSKLSLVLRRIVLFHSDCNPGGESQSNLHTELHKWQSELPAAIDWTRQDDQRNVFASTLKIVFHHHIILLHMGKGTRLTVDQEPPSDAASSSIEPAVSAARTIASSALSLMINSKVSSMPHEVYTGFFIAGVVFYRQLQQQGQSPLAQLQRSALDNCQVILHEARESCDAAKWMMRVFDFLLSSNSAEPRKDENQDLSNSHSGPRQDIGDQNNALAPQSQGHSLSYNNLNDAFMTDWELPIQQQDLGGLSDDFFSFLPDFYTPALGDFGFDV
ncbi:hypothetical protein LTR99_006352 [Exophiala xenobiotica]|uniref:Xylanolytic transcriptional activator regulatory domain-containing protein n=1 Tax=Vermiconidia calcicola TaxID=1690605 RepID=A0AAV9Q792_9PEZI|nr:hypothetical protein LTR92_010309 [Exophiala xenobiotica]KAK5537522.1 hypothetical protein LTR25_004774 [Vermiconidia calcicola]KAK5539236.1 hypothetical protein LTR23_006652 [Chaetothyriales sp. CCFEE 6169]KAK5242849.1 hypothetical protein LTS06_011240 [Exophiala xenobiotica]KAK5265253.1 hypothetical protein LTR96_009621 [Exophiala xenobiotica]